MPLPRRTLINSATIEGRGLFSGRPVAVRFHPASAGTGLIFRRTDLRDAPPIPAGAASLASEVGPPTGVPARNTTLRVGAAEVLTVEHALSACAGLGITDLVIELDGPELPIGDGSAALFTSIFWGAGLRYGGQDLEPIMLAREIAVGQGDTRITARPRSAPGCSYTYELDYGEHGPILKQVAIFDTMGGDYMKDIAPARTFCTLAEAEGMKQAGLVKDFTARDLLVIGPRGPIDNAYRFENEPARHKLLDLMGDLSLAGPIQADFVARRSGHALNHQMARALRDVW